MRNRLPEFITIAIAFGIAFLAYLTGALEPFELLTYDARIRYERPATVSPPIALVLVDDRSLAEFGQWPWPRSLHAGLIRRLRLAGARVIGFDIIFAEPDSKSADGDMLFARAAREAGNVICAVSFGEKHVQKGAGLFEGESPQVPARVIAEGARSLGHVLAIPDIDGVLRRLPMAVRSRGELYFSFAAELANLYWGVEPSNTGLFPGHSLRLGGISIPLDGTSSMLIDYRAAGARGIERFSYVDVLRGRVASERFHGKAVLVGFDATGLQDSYMTPLALRGEPTPGVMINALALATILEGRFIRRTGPTFVLLTALCASAGAVLAFGLLRVRGMHVPLLIAIPVGTCTLMVVGAWWALAGGGLWIDITTPLLAFILACMMRLGYDLIRESRMRSGIRAAFERYVAPEVVRDLLGSPDAASVSLSLGGTRRHVTVLFADIRGFTSFSQRHKPEEVVAILNRYLGLMVEAVFTESGTLDKFMGDGIMAVFGAPVARKDAAVRAFGAAVRILKSAAGLLPNLGIGIGIGIASGEAIVGNIGTAKRMDYTAIGDVVNRASRLQELAGAGDILMDEETYGALLDAAERGIFTLAGFGVEELGNIALKGIIEPAKVFAVSIRKFQPPEGGGQGAEGA